MTDEKQLKEFARSFDRYTTISKKEIAKVAEQIAEGEDILYLAKTKIMVDDGESDRFAVKDAAVALTSSKFLYVRAKSGYAVGFRDSTPEETIFLNETDWINFRRSDLPSGATPYILIRWGQKTYWVKLPINSSDPEKNARDWDRITKIFQGAREAYIAEVGKAEPARDEQSKDEPVFDEDKKPVTKEDLDNIERLAALRDSGVITEEEFEAKRKQILGI